MKKVLSALLAVLMVVSCIGYTVSAKQISVTLNGVYIDFQDQSPTIVDGRTLVPLRAIFESLGATVEWDAMTKTVTSQKGNISVSLSIGSNILYTNGQAKTLDVPAKIIGGRTMVPARAVAEAFGVKVEWDGKTQTVILSTENPTFDYNSVPKFSGTPYVVINNNKPFFSEADKTTTSFETYGNLDALGRCTGAYANIGVDILPTQDRGSIGSIKPSGWQTIKYELVDGKYLYNRCHLIGYQLSGENANLSNLITGTRYMNVEGMLPFENQVADYVQDTSNHVLYRATPIFIGNNLIASGVLLEAFSVEDNGKGISFNVFCYNVQPGIVIDYSNGNSFAEDGSKPYGSSEINQAPNNNITYIANKNTKKFHYPDCKSVKSMKESNKEYLNCSRDKAISNGYSPCGNCKP